MGVRTLAYNVKLWLAFANGQKCMQVHLLQHCVVLGRLGQLGLHVDFEEVVSARVVDIMSDSGHQVVCQLLVRVGFAEEVIEFETPVEHLNKVEGTCMREKPWLKLWYDTEL